MFIDETSSYDIFNLFIKKDGKTVEVSITSKACFDLWLSTRKAEPKNPAHAFRKALTGACRGDAGLKPFDQDVEPFVLKLLRQKKVWDCFQGTNVKIGERGFQSLGYWEKLDLNNKQDICRECEISLKKCNHLLATRLDLSPLEILEQIKELQKIIDQCNHYIAQLKKQLSK